MFGAVLKKLGRAVIILLVVSFTTFALMYGDGHAIARAVLGPEATEATEADVQLEMTRLGLDRPLLVQYGDWLKGVVTGDFGESFFTGQSVTSLLAARVPVTLALVILAIILTAVLSVLIGVTAAVRGGWIDRVVQFLAVLGAAIPPFIIAIALVFAFAISVRLFPATGYVSPDQSPTGWLESVTLPVLALLTGSVAGAASQFRGAVIDTLSRDFVRTLRARGISESRVIFRHVLRNAGGPGLMALNLQIMTLLGGAVFVEQIFALPGLGEAGNQASQQGDVPVVMGILVVAVFIVLVVNVLGDLANAALNPKARTR
ncbi:ABC transporter permease [Streptomyces sp. CA-210063]|uniref:ABC transporter permease n=1 Tax=Streptomyces sp. CA-210063 TaxID=2801029 RepID=UPI00214BD644|nr:ABC transporter permease [Streptomyces sp. CA-210063]UUU29764.1 ABC transporter permease [Streptomyces sp. CA-210063]